jgi:hypothetical protein
MFQKVGCTLDDLDSLAIAQVVRCRRRRRRRKLVAPRPGATFVTLGKKETYLTGITGKFVLH